MPIKTNYNIFNMSDFENREREEVFSKKVRAGKRTYFFDVKATRSNDYYVTITESKKRLEDGVFIKHKIFLYKEDFNRFVASLNDVVNHVKTELMPEFDYEEFDRRQAEWEAANRENEEDDGRQEDDHGVDEKDKNVDQEKKTAKKEKDNEKDNEENVEDDWK